MSCKSLSVIIPNWNGAKMLRPCIDSVTRALRVAGCPEPWEIIVADDGSTDEGVPMLRKEYPGVRLVQGYRRGGFIANANSGIQKCTNSHFLLLNNDVVLDAEFFTRWQTSFEDPTLFSVTGRMLRPDGVTYDSGRRVGVWDRGLIRHWVVCTTGSTSPTLFGSGGASIYDTQMVRSLGGLDDLYRPMYSEDLDLSYRAWKRGWKTMYQPSCLAYHHGSVSSKQLYHSRELSSILAKNHFLFIWKNITDPALTRQHLSWLPYWLSQGWRPRRRLVTLGFFKALLQLPEALGRRAQERRHQVVSDAEIWALFSPTREDLNHSPYLGWAGTA